MNSAETLRSYTDTSSPEQGQRVTISKINEKSQGFSWPLNRIDTLTLLADILSNDHDLHWTNLGFIHDGLFARDAIKGETLPFKESKIKRERKYNIAEVYRIGRAYEILNDREMLRVKGKERTHILDETVEQITLE